MLPLKLLQQVVSKDDIDVAPVSTVRAIRMFRESGVWIDTQNLFKARLVLNYIDSLDLGITQEQFRSLQGSSIELQQMLKLPDMLQEAVIMHDEKLKFEEAERIMKEQQTSETLLEENEV